MVGLSEARGRFAVGYSYGLSSLPANGRAGVRDRNQTSAANMNAPTDQRISVPIGDPNADTEWYYLWFICHDGCAC